MQTSKCADCGHAEPKHSKGRRGGCSVRVPNLMIGGRSSGRIRLYDCGCAVYRAPDGKTAPTIAELIEQDRARLAAADVSRETSPLAQAGNGEGFGIGNHM